MDEGTLNLIPWMLQGVPYRKVRKVVGCGVYYQRQIQFGPFAAYNPTDGLLRNLGARQRVLEFLPTGDSGQTPGEKYQPDGYGGYLDRIGMGGSNCTQFILGFRNRKNRNNPLVRRQSSSLSPSLSTCQSSGDRRLFQKKIEGFDCKINGRAFGAPIWHSLGVLDRRA